MLTPEQRNLLAETATSKYGLAIKSSQIAHLVLDTFKCNVFISRGIERFLIRGEVVDFRSYPLRMDFYAPEGSREREALKLRLGTKGKKVDLQFVCELASVGRVVRVNTLSISNSQIQELGILEKLFGPASSTFVNRDQVNQLAEKIYSSLNIVEEYEIPELQFQSIFVEDLIRQASAEQFQQVPALQALKELSSFGINFNKDLQPGMLLINLMKV